MSFLNTSHLSQWDSLSETPDVVTEHTISCSHSRWLDALCALLLGYILFGKGFAYLGIAPLFVGEAILLFGLYLFLRDGNWRYVMGSPLVWPLLILGGWGTFTTLPHLRTYGVDSLRDAMIWGYAAFAFFVMGILLAEPKRLQLLIRRYESLIPIYLALIPFTYALSQLELVPSWPWADAPIVDVKGGDVVAHLGGVLAFWATGLGRRMGKGWMVLLLGCAIVIGTANRGGLVGFMMAYGICLFFRPYNRLLWSIVLIGVCGLLFLAITDLSFELPGKEREVSAEKIIKSISSVFESSAETELDATKQWRINWWTDIVNYTWKGEYFWTGKGFGINLADSDGYQGTDWSGQLRSPHNGHLTMLARAGVPGFLFWIFPQLLWLWLIARACITSLAEGDLRWNGLFVFLLAYWASLISRATFDVYLEGPVGGIWFWTVYGVGLSAWVIYSYCPEAFAEQGSDSENPFYT